jgi:hypothetical protein
VIVIKRASNLTISEKNHMFNGGYGIKRRKMTVTSESSDDSRLLTKIREESRENEDDMCINESYCDKDKLFIGK